MVDDARLALECGLAVTQADGLPAWKPGDEFEAARQEALAALEDDHDYLMAGRVFNRELIDSWIEEKTKEVVAVRNRPHPFEMNLYYSL